MSCLVARLLGRYNELALILAQHTRVKLACSIHSFIRSVDSQLCACGSSHTNTSLIHIPFKLVGAVLGELGALELGAVSLSHGAVAGGEDALADGSTDVERQDRRLIRLLDARVVDADVLVAARASQCLRPLVHGVFARSLRKTRVSTEGLLLYLDPFLPVRSASLSDGIPDASCVQPWVYHTVSVEHALSWAFWDPKTRPVSRWIQRLTCAVVARLVHDALVDPIIGSLLPLVEVCAAVAEQVLHAAVHDLLARDVDGHHREAISSVFNHFFAASHTSRPGTDLGSPSSRVTTPMPASRPVTPMVTSGDGGPATLSTTTLTMSPSVGKEHVMVLLRTVAFLRSCKRQPTALHARGPGVATLTSWDNNFWLDLDMLSLARAAADCSALFSALFFAEVWAEVAAEGERTARHGEWRALLVEAYTRVGEPDSVYAVNDPLDAMVRARSERMYEGRQGGGDS